MWAELWAQDHQARMKREEREEREELEFDLAIIKEDLDRQAADELRRKARSYSF